MLLVLRQPDPPLALRWRGPDGALAPAAAASSPISVPTLIGPPGMAGPAGQAGSPGAVGPAGASGVIGPAGAIGPQGPAGPPGVQGLQGAQGPQGDPGSSGSDPWVWQKLAGDVANSTTTLAAVTGLSFAATADTTYLVELVGTFQAAASTTGIAVALDIPSGSVSGLNVHMTGSTFGGTEQVADNTTIGVSSAVRASNVNVPILASFIVAVGATGGTVQLQFRSEVAASAVTMKAGLTAMGRRVI